MFLLRREYRDGAERPEIVFLHAEVTVDRGMAVPPYRTTLVMAPVSDTGRRTAQVRVPEAPEGRCAVVRYRYSAVRGGAEWFSPEYEVEVPSTELLSDLYRIPEEEAGNLLPAPGCGYFRVEIPLAEGEPGGGLFRYGYGAMRKKPSPSLCRASVEAEDASSPVVEIPETLSVLKNRPMPYFLYHVSGDGILRSDKIACARITLEDAAGDVLCVRMLWGDPSWRAVNVSPMEAKGFPPGEAAAREEFHAPDRDAFFEKRSAALSRLPVPRVFEGFVFGPSNRRVEHCFQTVVRLPSGKTEVRWKNRDGGGNWEVIL